jgi:plasmid stabilization system protein ParE
MPSVLWVPKAAQDLEEILYYIRVTSGHPLTAERIGREFEAEALRLAEMPETGTRHPATPAEWRYSRHKRWLIFYLPRPHGIEVLRVIDAVRDLPRVLADSS